MSTNKKNFAISFACNCITLILLIEHLCDVAIALEFMHIWIGISTIVHIHILKDYFAFKC